MTSTLKWLDATVELTSFNDVLWGYNYEDVFPMMKLSPILRRNSPPQEKLKQGSGRNMD